jgi:hypothetical protein
MRQPQAKQEWMLLIHQLPPKPTNLRMRTWRKLQKLGAIAIKNSVTAPRFERRVRRLVCVVA